MLSIVVRTPVDHFHDLQLKQPSNIFLKVDLLQVPRRI